MAHILRHFSALNRKNFIIWRRNPICSCLEIIFPPLLFLLLVYLRTLINVKHVDFVGLEKYKHPLFPALKFSKEKWSFDPDYINQEIGPFMNFAGYTPVPPVTPGLLPNSQSTQTEGENRKGKKLDAQAEQQGEYLIRSQDIGKQDKESTFENSATDYNEKGDWMGPLYFLPDQCMRRFSWEVPKRASPIIALVGQETTLQTLILNYYKALKKEQKSVASIFVTDYEFETFANQTALFDYMESEDYLSSRKKKGICFAFEAIERSPNNYSFKFFFGDNREYVNKFSNGVPNQANPVFLPYNKEPLIDSYETYGRRGYGYLHNLAANLILKMKTGNEDAQINLMASPVPGMQAIVDDFGSILAGLLPSLLLIAFIPPVYNLVFRIVIEKESRAKESMRIMGMTDLPYWLSWFVYYTVINTAMSTLAWVSLLFNVINFSNPLYIWLFFWLYGQAVFGQVVFLQSLFSTSKYAGIVSTVVYFGLGVFLNFLLNANPDASRSIKILASLFPQVALSQGAVVFANYESTGVGINSSTAGALFENYDFNTALSMLAFSFLVFFLLGLYLDRVIPSTYGKAQNPCFCFLPSFWGCGRNRRQRQLSQEQEEEGEQNVDELESQHLQAENYEAASGNAKRLQQEGHFLKIRDLKKTYDSGLLAVKGVNLAMYEGQIFALLGHNGAGKSTVISMLTGLIERSEGTAHVYNTDLFEEMESVREFMGVCPQHDVLFDMLTPREHLDIFYDFKGGDPAKKQQEIDSLISDVGLTIDKDKNAHTLSGGNRRKLSVSIALCGGSKVVLLDEPTSGMDLGARRGLWDMLKAYKRDRIVILTTHYMDEADVLGDRIGIMASGQLMCIGSSLFLKNRFGLGYKLTLVKNHAMLSPKLEPFLQTYFAGVLKQSEVRGEVSFVIPRSQTSAFKPFFEVFDSRLNEFDIKSYGVSMTTLEEVFLKINQELAPEVFGSKDKTMDESALKMSNLTAESKLAVSIGHSTMRTSDVGFSELGSPNGVSARKRISLADTKQFEDSLVRGSNCCTTVEASSAKRWNIYKRDLAGFICQIVVPVLLVVTGLFFTSLPSTLSQSPPRQLSTGWYPGPQRILINRDPVIMANDGNDVSGEEIVSMLPNSTFFEPTYVDTNMTYLDFYNEVYERRNDEPLYPYRFGSYQIFQANKQSGIYQVTSFLNLTSQDVTAMYPHYLYQSLIRIATGDPDFTFDVTTEPFPVFYAFKQREQAARSFDYTFMVSIALALIPCVMVAFILNERAQKLKHQQLVSGMSLCGYWVSNLVCDVSMAYIPMLLIILLTAVFKVTFTGVTVLFLLFPLAIVPFSYITSFAFASDTTAQIVTLFVHFMGGAICSLTVFALQMIPTTAQVGDILRWVFCILPSFCVTHGILVSANGEALTKAREEVDNVPRPIPSQVWAFFNLKGDAVALLLHFFLGLTLLLLVESGLLRCCENLSCRSGNETTAEKDLIMDQDVLDEELRVKQQTHTLNAESEDTLAQTDSGNALIRDQHLHQTMLTEQEQQQMTENGEQRFEAIRVNDFTKQYASLCSKPVSAVTRVSFGLDYGECFALLGVNGAGKSTTFKSLTREILPSTGDISIQGYDVQKQFAEARKLIGYCPQYDAIFPTLTVEEHLNYYARVKGIPPHQQKSQVEKVTRELNLSMHRQKPAGTLSGGNKRKLSVAMAIIGNPPVILLDEPSAGMDPEARRFMWSVVEKISQRDKKSAVILTSHSMEEAEALSTKMGIMVRGGIFRCFGTSQHIKSKFGLGYEIELKVRKESEACLTALAASLDLGEFELSEKVVLDEAIQVALNCANLKEETSLALSQIKAEGLGNELQTESDLDDKGQIRLENLLNYLVATSAGIQAIKMLLSHFESVDILEHCGEYFKIRVPKGETSIGWLFGLIEEEKGQIGVQEYSVSQTSLEQIFQNFANNNLMDKAAFTFSLDANTRKLVLKNPNRETTLEQQQLSQRGLSFAETGTKQSFQNDPLQTNETPLIAAKTDSEQM